MTFILLSAVVIDSLYNAHIWGFLIQIWGFDSATYHESVTNYLEIVYGLLVSFPLFKIFVLSLKGLKVLVSSPPFFKISFKRIKEENKV